MNQLEYTQTVYNKQAPEAAREASYRITLVSREQGVKDYDLQHIHKQQFSLGRNPQENDIVLSSPAISGRHLVFSSTEEGLYLADCHPAGGIFILNNGRYNLVKPDRPFGPLREGMIFLLGRNPDGTHPGQDSVLMIISRENNRHLTWQSIPLEKPDYTIGRDSDNDIVLDHPAISRHHAVIYAQDGNYAIQDTNSRNGVFVNGKKLHNPIWLQEKDIIVLAGRMMIYTNRTLFLNTSASGIELSMCHLTKRVGKEQKTILHDINCTIHSNEFIAIVGGSGAGKSTLLKIIGGYDPHYEGDVLYNGISLDEYYHILKNIIGYVPQEDIVYENLTLYRMLSYAARMKMPDSTSEEEIDRKIHQVSNLMELSEHEHTMIRNLSGGQKKRASIAVELLADPGMFFLDEPTSGLDPGTEKKLMNVLSGLARNQGKTIVMVTHTTQSLDLCDKILFMGKGGKLTFFGTPGEAMKFFRTDNLIDIYNLLEEDTDTWADRFNDQQSESSVTTPSQKKEIRYPAGKSAVKQFLTLQARYAELIKNDQTRLLLLFLQPILIAFLLRIVANKNILFHQYEMTNQILFTYSCSAIWIGIFNTIQEVCKERAILKREYMSNLKLPTYILSKYVVQLLISFIQSLLFSLLFVILFHNEYIPHKGVLLPYYPELLLTTWLTIFTASAMGLLVSCIMKNADRAMALSPFILIIQLLFSGVLFENRSIVSQVISAFTISRWSVSALGSSTNLKALESKVILSLQETGQNIQNPEDVIKIDEMNNFVHTASHMGICWGMLLLFIIIFSLLSIHFLQNISNE